MEEFVNQLKRALFKRQIHQQHYLSHNVIQELVDVLVGMEKVLALHHLRGRDLVEPPKTHLDPLFDGLY